MARKNLELLNSPYLKHERELIETELSSIEPMSPLQRKLTSAKGFADYYVRMKDLYASQVVAYELLEEYHTQITGKRKYSEYDSFRGVLERKKITN